jgi:hypothetical protein
MAIHHVNVKPETIATLLEAAEQARMTLLDFESWVLDDWARLYRLEQAKRFTPAAKEDTHAISERG